MIRDRMREKRGVMHPQTPLVQGQPMDPGTGFVGGMLLGEVIEGMEAPPSYSASEGVSADE